MNGREIWTQAFGLGDRSVFQAELYGIRKAAQWMLTGRNRRLIVGDEVNIYTDNQAVLQALKGHFIKKKQVLEVVRLLNCAVIWLKLEFLTLKWVKGHAGYIGNEKADEMAKKGATMPVQGDIPLHDEKDINAVIKKLMLRDWEKDWQTDVGETKQTRLFYPYLRPKHSWEVLNQMRPIYSLLIQLETGHNYMARHQHIIAENNKPPNAPSMTDPTCTLCGTDEETSAHILAQCKALEHLRVKHFKSRWLSPPYTGLEIKSVIGFLKEANMEAFCFAFEKQQE